MGIGIGAALAIAAGTAAVGAGATIGSGMSAADSQGEMNEENSKNAARQRLFEERIYGYSRGKPDKTGDISAILPYYGAEEQYYNDAQNLYNATGAIQGTPQQQYANYASMLSQFLPAWQRGNQTINDISSGQMLNDRMAEAAPVAAGRRAVAQGQQQAILEAMIQQQNKMIAQRKLQGFTGAGTSSNNNLFGASITARQAAANQLSGANLQNELMTQAIRDTQRGLQLTSLDLPLTRAKQTIEAYNLPTTAVNQNFTNRLAPFEFFRIAPTSYRPTASPLVGAVPNAGQVVGQGIAQFAGGLGNYYANQALIRQMQQQQGIPATTPGVQGTPGSAFPSAGETPIDWGEYPV